MKQKKIIINYYGPKIIFTRISVHEKHLYIIYTLMYEN